AIGDPLQDLGYESDLAGNIVSIRDRTLGSGIPNTPLGVDALERSFGYDALYRLISATGRETDFPPNIPWDDVPRSADITRARAYTERYAYERADNIKEVKHSVNGGGFNRTFALSSGSNRLDTVSIGSNNYKYEYDANGNMVKETSARHYE